MPINSASENCRILSAAYRSIAGLSNTVKVQPVATSPGGIEGDIADLREQVQSLKRSLLPGNPVIAFDSEACPEGWKQADITIGRVIVGDGAVSPPVTSRPYRDRGGKNTIQLTEAELPPLNPDIGIRVGSSPGGRGFSPGGPFGFWFVNPGPYALGGFDVTHAVTKPVGGTSEPIDTAVPYVALTYCSRP
jgi:hypothetical protein